MAFPAGALGLMPWMNARESGQPQSGIVSFSFGADIVFKWAQDGTASYDFPIYANGRYGTDGTDVNHYPWVWIVGSYPGTPDNTPADRTALAALTAVEGESAQLGDDSSWWYGIRKGLDVFWIPMRTRTAAGTATAWGITADIYTATVPVADLPKYQGIERIAGGYYDLCWNGNSMHAPEYDGQLFISPTGIQLQDNIFQRTEFNTRTAGEKALYPDEFVAIGQVEGGHNVTIAFRTVAGALTGYGTVAAKGANLVIEARSNVKWRDEYTVLNYEDSQLTVTFQDWPRLHEEPDDSILPINFYVETVGTEVVVKGYAHNNNLYISRTDLSTVNHYPMDDAGFNIDTTINHIRFNDTAAGTWNIVGTTMPTQTPEGIINRKGVIIEFTPTGGGMTKWVLGDGAATTFDIDDAERVYFAGTNGVTTVATDLGGGDYQLLIDRPLTIKQNDVPVSDGPPSTNTIHINFRDDDLRYFCDPVPWANSPVDVTDRQVTADPTTIVGQRDVRHYFPAEHAIYTHRWFCDYNPASTGRSLGYIGGRLVDALFVGSNGFVGEPIVHESIMTDPQYFIETYQLNAGDNAYDPVSQSKFKSVLTGFPGWYEVDVTIEGILGLNIPAGSAYNPVIHPALHLFIMNGATPYDKPNNIAESCGCFNIFDFINPAGVPIAAYAQVYNSRPWSIKGKAYVKIGVAQGQGAIYSMLTYNPGTGENRFFYQVTHQSIRIRKLAGVLDLHIAQTTLGADDKIPPTTLGIQGPINFHNQNFNGV